MKASKSTAVREAKSRELLREITEIGPKFGLYSEIFDRQNQSVDRYLEREGVSLPSTEWTRDFVEAGGSFDSCGSWGITPYRAIELEFLGIPAEFAGRMLALLGRADYDFSWTKEVFEEGINPQKRAEFHACVNGINRQKLAQKAKAGKRSVMRLGWMKNEEFSRYIIKTSKVVGSFTDYWTFNGISIRDEDGKLLVTENFLKNPIFANWFSKRPTGEVMKDRRFAKEPIRPTGWLEKVPPHLMAVAMRQNKQYYDRRTKYSTTVGEIVDCGDGGTLVSCDRYDHRNKSAKKVIGRKIKVDLSVAQIKGMWFVWNPTVGFQNHMENISLKEAVRLWENRSHKGEPRPLCLNEVRNDRSGTAGFCLAGTKAFLQNRMPFVYNLIRKYSSWSEIPNDIMSTVWDINFKVFKGYPVP